MKPIAYRWRAKGWSMWTLTEREPDLDRRYYEVQALGLIAPLKDALEQALEYMTDHYDVIDGPDGTQLPNKEMRLGQMIDETLHGRPY